MNKNVAEPSEKITWKALRLRASKLGIPAWQLAENLQDEELWENTELGVKNRLEYSDK